MIDYYLLPVVLFETATATSSPGSVGSLPASAQSRTPVFFSVSHTSEPVPYKCIVNVVRTNYATSSEQLALKIMSIEK